MKLFEALKIALHGLASNKMRSLLTMLGVIIGVGSVITLVSIGEGVKSSISSQIQGLGSNLILVTPGRGKAGVNVSTLGAVNRLTYDDALAVERNADSVKNVAPVIESSAYIQYKSGKTTLVSGTTESYAEVRNFPVRSGDFISRGDIRGYRPVAVIGDTVRKELFPGQDPLNKTLMINSKDYEIIGVMGKKGRTLTIDNDDRVFIPITAAESLFNTKQVSMMFIQSESPKAVSTAVDETKRIITDRHKKMDFAVSEQKDILDAFEGITGTLTQMLGGIAGVSLLVGGIGIMNIMLVTVTERTREIGIRKSVGAKKRDIMFQFLLESMFISAFGGLLGIGAGIGGTRMLKDIVPKLPTIISPWSIGVAFLFALLVGLFFGIYPARKAARLSPIEALRYE
ncbi:MAG: ABC transporter permease [Eubacteriales bacterium]